MTVREYLNSKANVECIEVKDGKAYFYLVDHEDADGKWFYEESYLQTVCAVLGEKWSVFHETDEYGDIITAGICVEIR